MFNMLNNPNLNPEYKKAYMNEAYFMYNKFPVNLNSQYVKDREELYNKISENIPEFNTGDFILYI